MTPEKQRIAIAEACGWKHIKRLQSGWHGWIEPGPLEELPDYLNDLNAMHEAEKILTPDQRRKYVFFIFNLPSSQCESNTFATAAQRAKAFLRTIGKWGESK